MNICRSSRCIFSTPALTPFITPCHRRSLHNTEPRQARRRRAHYPSVKVEDLKLLSEIAEKRYPQLDTSERALLEKKYTKSQIAAIKAAEAAVDTRDVVMQGQGRTDPWRLNYKDDLAEVDPVTDSPERLDALDIPGSINVTFANPSERDAATARIATENLAKLYPDGTPEGQLTNEQEARLQDSMEAALSQAALDPRTTYTSKNPAVLNAIADPRYSVILPDLPRLDNRVARHVQRLAQGEEEDPREKRLLQYLGWEKQKLRGIRVKTLVVHGVTNQTRMGKIRSLYHLTIAGNQDGLLGVGEGKSVEPEEGRKQSVMAAIRNMKPVPRYENRTTFGDLEKKVGATKVQLFSRPPGFGLRTQHLIFEMARAAGLRDLAAKTPRSRNKMNVIKATWEALTNQKLPDEIARGRGKKLVDVRKVYYGGAVH